MLIAATGLALCAVVVNEHLTRRSIERRYQAEVGHRRQVERQYSEALASHERLTQEIVQERRHSQELSNALLAARAKMEETVGRLTEENRIVQELQARLAAMQQHMDQLQGELAITLQRRESEAGGVAAAQVELDRIIVSQAGATSFQGRVVSVHPDWNFVVVSLGWDAVKIGEVVSIVREDQVLAKARVERIQEGVCAATILPEWKIADVRVNDVARAL